MGHLVSDVFGWLDDLRELLPTIEPRYLVLALLLQSLQTLLNAVAWRSVLAARYDLSGARGRQIIGAYCGGVGLNAFLPVQAGTIAYLGVTRAVIAESHTASIVAASFVQNLFYLVTGICLGGYLLTGQPQATDATRGLLSQNIVVVIAAAALIVIAVGLACRIAWHHVRRLVRQLEEGAAILRRPAAYVSGVLVPQLGSYACRIGVNMTFMAALGIDVSFRAVLLLVAANSISMLVAVTPGGVGTQQALAVVALRGVAPAGVAAAFSLTTQAITTAWNILFGLTVMAAVFGWSATVALVRGHRGGGDLPPPPPPPALAQ